MTKKTTRKRKEVPADETKLARFVRVVTPRINKAVKAINTIGFCAASSYEHTPEQVAEIKKVLTQAVSGLEKKFAGEQDAQSSFGFSE